MNEVKNLLFIINKFAGTSYQTKLESQILAICKNHRTDCSIEYTTGRGHATELAKAGLKKNFSSVIAVGGDGTVNEVAQGLLHTSVPMGIIARGSGNGLARHLGIKMKPQLALNQLLTGKVIAMDTFRLNNHLSLNVSGIGFDGHIANLFASGKNRGFWGYTKLVVSEYLSCKEFEAEIQLDNKASLTKKSFLIAIANASQYGNNARVAPIASIMDQSLQLASVKKIPAQRGFKFAYQMFVGKLETGKNYECLAFQKATIKVPQPVAFHIDGEPCGNATEFRIEILPSSLNMIVPASSFGKI